MRNRLLQIGTLGILLLAGASASADNVVRAVDRVVDKIESTANTAGHETSDAWLTAKTKLALFADSRISGAQINVETKNGTITLRGKVDSESVKAAAAEIASGIDGKKDLKDELHVVVPARRKVVDATDDYIVSEVNRKLAKERLLHGSKINVRSDAGVVTLSGDVPTLVASAVASEAAFRVDGVRYVKNTLAEKPK
jgi:hyperosmotically inducible protein